MARRPPPPPPPPPPVQLIDLQYVWLHSNGMYLHADEDWRGVSMRPNPMSLNTVWRVERISTEHKICILQSAAYGRYLAATNVEAQARPGCSGFRTEQRDFEFDDVADPSFRWGVFGTVGGTRIYTFSATARTGFFLRSNGYEYDTGVTAENPNLTATNPLRMYLWTLESVPLAILNPLLTTHWTVTLPLLGPHEVLGNVEEEGLREIRFMRLSSEGPIDANWVVFPFAGRSLFNLRNQLAPLLGEGVTYTISIVAGCRARPATLVVDLPISGDPLYIFISIM